jgi:hypothetical protein
MNEEVNDKKINIYPYVRTSILTLCVLLGIGIILFLMYINGKILYENSI